MQHHIFIHRSHNERFPFCLHSTLGSRHIASSCYLSVLTSHHAMFIVVVFPHFNILALIRRDISSLFWHICVELFVELALFWEYLFQWFPHIVLAEVFWCLRQYIRVPQCYSLSFHVCDGKPSSFDSTNNPLRSRVKFLNHFPRLCNPVTYSADHRRQNTCFLRWINWCRDNVNCFRSAY